MSWGDDPRVTDPIAYQLEEALVKSGIATAEQGERFIRVIGDQVESMRAAANAAAMRRRAERKRRWWWP